VVVLMDQSKDQVIEVLADYLLEVGWSKLSAKTLTDRISKDMNNGIDVIDAFARHRAELGKTKE